MTKKTREEKYQALRLYHSGGMSLGDIKAQFRITATVTRSQYSKQSDQKQFLGTKERIERLQKMAMTRGSSLGKISTTKYLGFKKFNKDYDKLMKALLDFSRDRPEQGKAIASRMGKMRNSIKLSTKG